MDNSSKGVKRQRVCPGTLCIYELVGSDLASLNEVGSAVLEAPPVGIFAPAALVDTAPAKKAHTGDEEEEKESTTTAQGGSVEPVKVMAPTLVLPVWGDTALSEITMALVKRIRDSVDSAFEEKKKKEEALEAAATIGDGTLEKPKQRDAHPSQNRLPAYRVEWTAGYVSPAGRATMVPLGAVEVRQVVQGSGALFPVRRRENLDYTKTLTEIDYETGDPLFFTCVRV